MREYWKHKILGEMSLAEWEALCDGCGRCCLRKLEDPESGDLAYTCVACRLLDPIDCRCLSYRRRAELVEECLVLRPLDDALLMSLPATCAYRRLAEGKDLPDWHPLVSGDPGSVHAAGISVRGRVISEQNVHPDDLEQFIVDWPQQG